MHSSDFLPQGSTILMVDDTPANLAVVARHLEDEGFRVLVAEDGEEALDRVNYARPDLILLDVMMPGPDGFEICRRLKADPATRHIPVIFMTALGNTEDKLAAFRAGAVDYVTKPVDTEEVLARVRTHLGLHFLQQELLAKNQKLEHEVAERRQAESQLRAANTELDSFAYAVSHDLRAPLRGMMGCAQILLADYADGLSAEGRAFLTQITRASQQMSDLIDGLLRLSRSTRGDMARQPVDLSALAETIRADLERTRPARAVEWHIEPGLTARGDPRLMEVALRNLLDNAWKYTAVTEPARIRFYAEGEGGKRRFCVADNGAGFDMKYASNLFKPFQRLHRDDEFPGIGIGLATVQRIIHRHGGTLDVCAARGQGATFCFTLPEDGAAQEG